MADEVMLSREGYDKLAKELEMLKMVERPRIADNIREATPITSAKPNRTVTSARTRCITRPS